MIKSISKSDNLLLKVLGRSKQKQSLPFVKKPLISYMSYLDLEPQKFTEINRDFSLGGLLYGVTKAYLDSKTKNKEIEHEAQTITKSETEVETQTETIREEKVERKTSYNYSYDYSYHEYKEPVIKRIFEAVGNVLMYPIEKFQEWRSDFIYERHQKELRNIQKRQELETIIRMNPFLETFLNKELIAQILSSKKMSSKKVNELVQKTENLVKIHKQKELEELQELQNLRKEFTQKMKQYKSMFTPDDIMPDLSVFNGWGNASLDTMNKLIAILDTCIAHQNVIISLKKKFLQGALSYIKPKEQQHTTSDNKKCNKIKWHCQSGEEYRLEFDRLFALFIKRSKELELPITDFHHVSTRFFESAKKKIEEIFELKQKFKWFEKIPKLGLIPKSIRVTGQINLTRCIMKDYKDINNRYVSNDINIQIEEYNQLFNDIKKFLNFRRKRLNAQDRNYYDKALERMANIREKQILTYQKLFDIYAKGGCNISNICNKVRLEGLVSLVAKTVATFGSPF